jgi:hypothetical protein
MKRAEGIGTNALRIVLSQPKPASLSFEARPYQSFLRSETRAAAPFHSFGVGIRTPFYPGIGSGLNPH